MIIVIRLAKNIKPLPGSDLASRPTRPSGPTTKETSDPTMSLMLSDWTPGDPERASTLPSRYFYDRELFEAASPRAKAERKAESPVV